MYGIAADARKSLKGLGEDQGGTFQLQPIQIVAGTLIPAFVFVFIFRTNISWLRHSYPLETVVVTMVLPVLINFIRSNSLWRKVRDPERYGNPGRFWLCTNVVMWFVIIYACFQGDKAYWKFAKSYFDYQDMASYINIDPSTDRGQSYMDAGQVYFKEGTQVEVSKAIAFQEDQIYCVAPIVQQSLDSGGDKSGNSLSGNALKMPASGTMDFWAVGINCCDPSGLNFKCGDSANGLARAGMRELRDDTRPYFLMAVQEWTAWLKLPAKHPLFFYWVQDPLLQVDNFWLHAMTAFYISMGNAVVGALLGTFAFQFMFYSLGF